MNSRSSKEEYGCVIVFMMIFLIPMIIELIKTLIPVAFLAAIGYCLYQLHLYNSRTGNITNYVENVAGLNKKNNVIELPPPKQEPLSLAAPQEDFQQQIKELKDQLEQLQLDNEHLQQRRKADMEAVLRQYGDHISKKHKEGLMQQVFGDPTSDYARSDEFEKQEFRSQVRKKEEDLDNRAFKQGVEEQMLELHKSNHQFHVEIKEETHHIRQDLTEGFAQVDARFVQQDEKIMALKGFVIEKLAQMETMFQKELVMLKDAIGRLRVELKQDVSDVRVQFGKEIVRIDKQQNLMLGKLGECFAQLKGFSYEVRQVKLDAERFAMRGEDMLNRANTLYQRHRADMLIKSKDLEVGLQHMAIHKEDFANRVGAAKLQMDKMAQDQHLALKDMAYERIGINMLREDYNHRAALEQQKRQNLINQQQFLLRSIREQQTKGQQVAQLRHRLYMTEEDLRYTTKRANLMMQEQNIIRRLSR